jgi:8-oxo-dGTP diphosphatase
VTGRAIGDYRVSIAVSDCVGIEVARVSVLAAGGIVLRREHPPRIAVVRLRKRDEWVLPKGKLDEGETARAAAKREVLEETGHNVTVHEFLGTLVYEAGGRSKVVHYWSMEASDEQTRELMSDIRAVDWLPLDAALERLSRGSERAFLETVGPLAMTGLSRRLRTKPPGAREPAAEEIETTTKAQSARKRRSHVVVRPEPVPVEPVLAEPALQPELVPELAPPMAAADERADTAIEVLAAEPLSEIALPAAEPDFCATSKPLHDGESVATDPVDGQRRSLADRLREWLGRAA